MLRVMSEMVKLRKVIEGSWRVRGAVGKVVEEDSELSGGYGVQETDASAVKENDTGKALGTSASPAEAPSVQAGVCEGSGGSAAGAVSGTPDQHRLLTALDVHVRGGQGVPPTLAAISGRIEEAAVVKAVGSASGHADSASTVSTVLWESRVDVDDRAGFDDGGKVEAAGGATATVSSMQVVEEEIKSAMSKMRWLRRLSGRQRAQRAGASEGRWRRHRGVGMQHTAESRRRAVGGQGGR